MVLFVLRKLILQTRMRSHPVGLDVWYLVGPFVYFLTLWVRTAKALARQRGCAGSPEPSLVAYAISTIIPWAGSNGNMSIILKFPVLQSFQTITIRLVCVFVSAMHVLNSRKLLKPNIQTLEIIIHIHRQTFIWDRSHLFSWIFSTQDLVIWHLITCAYCSCCPYLYFGSAIMLVTYFVNFRYM